MKVDRTDVSSWLIAASVENNSLERDRNWLNGDSIAIIIAGRYVLTSLLTGPLCNARFNDDGSGSDTVAPSLVFLFYELALHPDQAKKLHAELLPIDIYDRKALQALPHLNGFIQETLRLHPPVPSGGYRETPPEGITVAGQYIPGRTTIVSPRYSLGRCTFSLLPLPLFPYLSFRPIDPLPLRPHPLLSVESCFEKPLQFIPERWYSQPNLVKDKRAYAPFSQGTPCY